MKFRTVLFCTLSILSLSPGNADDFERYYSPRGILAFADYLFQEPDYNRAIGEYKRYLALFPEGDAAGYAELRTGQGYRFLEDYNQAVAHLNKAAAYVNPEETETRIYYEKLLILVLAGRIEEAEILAGKDEYEPSASFDAPLFRGVLSLLSYRYSDSITSFRLSLTPLSRDLMHIAAAGEEMPRKSIFGAMVFSLVIPGAGKMYAGRWKDGLFSLVSIGTLAGLTAYTMYREGRASVKGWLYLSLGGILHIGNVYGAGIAAKQFNEFQKDRIRRETIDALRSAY